MYGGNNNNNRATTHIYIPVHSLEVTLVPAALGTFPPVMPFSIYTKIFLPIKQSYDP
jgi:hypothetical protein